MPIKKEIPREEIPWYPTIDKEICNECMTCVEFCQHRIFSDVESELKVVKPINYFVGFSGCQPNCPEGAISFPSIKEISQLLQESRKRFQINRV